MQDALLTQRTVPQQQYSSNTLRLKSTATPSATEKATPSPRRLQADRRAALLLRRQPQQAPRHAHAWPAPSRPLAKRESKH